MTRRTDRVNELLRKEISQIISRDMNDPRITGLLTISQVNTSTDLRQARISVSVMGEQQQKEKALGGLKAAAGFIRHRLGGKLSLKRIPELSFLLDASMEQANDLVRLMDQVASEEETGKPATEIG